MIEEYDGNELLFHQTLYFWKQVKGVNVGVGVLVNVGVGVLVNVGVTVGVTVDVGVGEIKQGSGVIVGVGVFVGVLVTVGVIVFVGVGVGVGLTTFIILGHFALLTNIVYVPNTSRGGFKVDGSNVYGKMIWPNSLFKFIVTLTLSGLNNISADSPS